MGRERKRKKRGILGRLREDQVPGPPGPQHIAVQVVAQQPSERAGELHHLLQVDPGGNARFLAEIQYILRGDVVPAAPGTKGQPPSPPKELSNRVMPASIAAMMLAMASPRVLWK